MEYKVIKEFRDTLKAKVSIGHLLISSLVLSGLVYGLFILSIVVGWTCCPEPAKSSTLFSDFTLFWILTVDLFLLLLLLSRFYRISKQKKVSYSKSYLILGIGLIVLYLVAVPWFIIINE